MGKINVPTANTFTALVSDLINQIKDALPTRESGTINVIPDCKFSLEPDNADDQKVLARLARIDGMITNAENLMNDADETSAEYQEHKAEVIKWLEQKRLVLHYAFGHISAGKAYRHSFLDALYSACDAINASNWAQGDVVSVINVASFVNDTGELVQTYSLKRAKSKAGHPRVKRETVELHYAGIDKVLAEASAG